MKKLTIALIIAVTMTSCGTQKELWRTGYYKVESRKGDTTKFKGIKQKYLVLSDTLKTGDRIKINIVRLKAAKKKVKQNVFLPQ